MTDATDLPGLPEDLLRAWPGRFRSSDVMLWLHGTARDGAADLADAVLADIADGQDEDEVLAALIGGGEFTLAELMLTECPALSSRLVKRAARDIEAAQSAMISRLSNELRRLEEMAAAADVVFEPPVGHLEELALDSWPEAGRILADLEEDITGEVGRRAGDLRGRLEAADVTPQTTRMIESLLAAGRLRAAVHVLKNGTLDLPGPEIQPPLMPWRWTEPASEVLRWHIDPNIPRPAEFAGGAPADEAAQYLLDAVDGLSAGGDGAARALTQALDEFLGPAPEVHVLHAIPGGFLTSVHNLFRSELLSRFRPTGTVPLFVAEPGVSLTPQLPGVEHFLAVGPALEPSPPQYRGAAAVISVRDFLRLITVPFHRDISLARLAGRQWSLAGLSASSAADLAQLLGAAEKSNWQTLCWLTDLAGLGGSATADALLFQSGGHPGILHALLEHLLRLTSLRSEQASAGRMRAWRDDEQTAALVEAALLQDCRSPSAQAAFWSAVAAAPPETPLTRDALVLAASLIEDNINWDAPIRSGFDDLAGQWFTEPTGGEAITLRRTGVMIGLRRVAERRIEALAADLRSSASESGVESGLTAWAAYRFSLSPEWPTYREMARCGDTTATAQLAAARESLRVPVERLLEQSAVLAGEADVTTVVAELQAAAAARYTGISVEVDSPPGSMVAVHERVALAMVYELLDNAVEELGGIGTVALTVRVTGQDVFIDVRDSGQGLATEIDSGFRVFRSGFSTRGTGRGYGLFMVRQIAQRHEGDVELVSRADGHPVLRGAHFRLILPGRP